MEGNQSSPTPLTTGQNISQLQNPPPNSQVIQNTAPSQQQPLESLSQAAPEDKHKSFFNKKTIFLVIVPVIIVIATFVFILSKVGAGFIAEPKYLPYYLPTGLTKTGVKYENTEKGENGYTVNYMADNGGNMSFIQIYNPSGRECTDQSKTYSGIKNYHEFLPDGSVVGCVHSTDYGSNQGMYFRWSKDGVWFELITLNYDLSDGEAMKIANSIQLQESSQSN